MQQQKTIYLYYSFCVSDQALYARLTSFLRPLVREMLLQEWSEKVILAGSDVQQERKRAFSAADIILLLLSAEYLASEDCYQEMLQALARQKRSEARVIPILLRPCDWQSTPLAVLRCLPRNNRAIILWGERMDEAFLDIAQNLRQLLKRSTFPQHPLPHIQQYNRRELLSRVQRTWIEGFLENSLYQSSRLHSSLLDQSDILAHPWGAQIQEMRQVPLPLPKNADIVRVYDETRGELLLLGEPGAGKTTLLLELARTLLQRAQSDPMYPIPVVFNLSSWAQERLPLTDWLSKELEEKYRISPHIGRSWLEAQQILLLLDGLDEVAADVRDDCVKALSSYAHNQTEQPEARIVVCCRSQEYRTLAIRLPFNRAVCILPLTSTQVEAYLLQGSSQLDILRTAIKADEELAKLASYPLMLSIFSQAYQNATEANFSRRTAEAIVREAFGTYIKKVLTRRGQLQTGTEEQFLQRLSYLARQMQQRKQTIFQIEDLQPDWLLPSPESDRPQQPYLLLTQLIGPLGGLLMGLLQGLIGWLLFGLLVEPLFGLLTGLLIEPLVGLLLGLGIVMRFVETAPLTNAGRRSLNRKTTHRKLIVRRDISIHPVERFHWGWKSTRSTAGYGLFCALFVGVFTWWLRDAREGLLFGLIGGLFGILVGGLADGLFVHRLVERTYLRANEGIWRSGKNGLKVGLLVGLPAGLLMGLLIGWLVNLPDGLINGLPGGLHLGLFFGLFAALILGLSGGLAAFAQHFLLRLFLWRANLLPWKLVPFLNEAAERSLLRKVGGGYLFAHRLLQDYLASLTPSK